MYALRHLRPSCPPFTCYTTPVATRAHSRCASHLRRISSTSACRGEPAQKPDVATHSVRVDGPVEGLTANGKEKVSAVQADGTQEPLPLPLLQRPLGLPERPTTQVKTWAQTREELMDQDKRLEKRHHLCVSNLLHTVSGTQYTATLLNV